MASKSTVTVVVSEEQREMFLMMAQERGQSLSAYMRDRLLANDNLEAEFRALQGALIATIHEGFRERQLPDKTTPSQDAHTALLLETVLLLRSLSNPLKSSAVFAEMKRLGVTPFTT